MITPDCVCKSCVHYGFLPAQTYGDPNDCYDSEEWCDEDMENFNSTEGCYLYEYKEK